MGRSRSSLRSQPPQQRPAGPGSVPPRLAAPRRGVASGAPESMAGVLVARTTPPGPLSRPAFHDLGLVRTAARRETAAARLVPPPGPGGEYPHGRAAVTTYEGDGPPVPAGPAPLLGNRRPALGPGAW